ncbi:MAG: ATP-binding cassette domain-containing protein [Acidobacteriota bacterium]
MTSVPSIVQFDRVSFAYPARAPVLQDVSFGVPAGDVLALVGRSGAGKSTILKLVNRLLLPQSGRVEVEGRDTREWSGIPLRRRIGYVLQDVGLFPHMTVSENVGLVPRLEKWDPARTRTRVRALLDLVGLPADAYAARRPNELSGGQRQRVGVARALAVDPPILLMDEPFGALDPITRVEIRREFTRIRRELGTTVLLVTHDLSEAFALATRIGVLDDGALIIWDTPAVVAASRDPRVRKFLDTVTPLPDFDADGGRPASSPAS